MVQVLHRPSDTSTVGDLQRNLLYTAVTRAKRLVVLAGSRKALAIAVRTAGTGRHTALTHRRHRPPHRPHPPPPHPSHHPMLTGAAHRPQTGDLPSAWRRTRSSLSWTTLRGGAVSAS